MQKFSSIYPISNGLSGGSDLPGLLKNNGGSMKGFEIGNVVLYAGQQYIVMIKTKFQYTLRSTRDPRLVICCGIDSRLLRRIDEEIKERRN